MDRNIALVHQKSIAEVVAEKLRQAILSGELFEGQKLNELELCEKLNVSRTPVREAFRVLQAEGYLTHNPRHGVVVTQLTLKDVRNMYEVRSCLEQLMVFNIAGDVNPEALMEMQQIISAMRALDLKDAKRFYELDGRMHEVLVQNCSNEKLRQLIINLRNSTYMVKYKSGFSPQRAHKSIQEHCDLVDAIANGDRESARRTMELHFQRALRFVEKRLGMV